VRIHRFPSARGSADRRKKKKKKKKKKKNKKKKKKKKKKWEFAERGMRQHQITHLPY